MKQIPLTQGRFALVDDADFERLNAYNWSFHKRGYAVRWSGYLKGHVYMHMDILGPTPPGLMCDHKYGNKLDYRRENLRHVTRAQNGWNRTVNGKRVNGRGFKGIYFANSPHPKWGAKITVHGRRLYLGKFTTKEEAARAYDAASRIHHGPYGRLNFPDPEPVPGFPLAV